jgi:hypothetical protein
MTSSATMLYLLASIREHLAAHRLSTSLVSVSVGCDVVHGDHATVHLQTGDLAGLAAVLLVWAHTLAKVSVTAWRPPHGETVHLSLVGERRDSTRIVVFGGVPFSDTLFGDLQPEGQHGVPLTVLRSWTAGMAA